MGTILVVDDEVELRELLAIYLKMKGFEVHEAGSGSEALEILKQNQSIRLVISDIQMPKGDGMFLLKTLKNDLKSSVTVFMYSGGSIKELSLYKAEGADAVFEKPINLANLVNVIRQFLEAESA
jgi:CheY-like chemotaxis protein